MFHLKIPFWPFHFILTTEGPYAFYSVPPLLAFERVQRNGKRWIQYTAGTNNKSDGMAGELGSFLLQPHKEEGCFACHSDMYPDLAYDPDDPDSPDCSCFSSLKNGRWFPVEYSSLDYDPARKPGPNPSLNYIEHYADRKRGHLTHLVYQPFGLGRMCLDCHDKSRYQSNNAASDGHGTGGKVFFQDGKTLDATIVCTGCHGGFYPKGSHAWDINIGSPSKIDPNSVRVLEWSNPATVTCLQCHDDSKGNGGIYASYISRHSIMIEKDYMFYNDLRYDECRITAPDPDAVPGWNYWFVNGHGAMFDSSYAGATLDTEYPGHQKASRPFHSKGNADSPNIPIVGKEQRQSYDLNLDQGDGNKNLCWECHLSNETVRNLICAESSDYPEGLPIGKYNGHIDTKTFKDERWTELSPKSTMSHSVWKKCRECHPSKYSHIVCESSQSSKYQHEARDSQCIVCHNPHGSGSENGRFNLFMIKGRIYKCDTREGISTFNSPSISANTSDICEVCHQEKDKSGWKKPGADKYPDIKSEPHQNGARHYFDPNKNPGATPDVYLIDYRDSDCTGCHIHDPDPPLPLPPYTPDEERKLEDTTGMYPFNSKAFAPTCRCHGIGRIDIGTLEYKEYRGRGNKPDITGKGHGTPPPPFPDGRMRKDPHRAHAVYNFPCRECHIDPRDLLNSSYDPDQEYIFPLDGQIHIGFDPSRNPYGRYEKKEKTCTNLYCHSNGKGLYTSVTWKHTWDESVILCRDPYNPQCKDENGRFNYCGNCHSTPPDKRGTDHSKCTASCDRCHPHNGIYEQKPGFYKHVNGRVDVLTRDKIINTFEPKGCGCCHSDEQKLDFHRLSPLSSLTQQFPEGSCLGCHDDEHRKFVICDAMQRKQGDVDACCLKCHQNIIGKPLGGLSEANKNWVHSASKDCTLCHDMVCGIINSNDPNVIENIEVKDPNVLNTLSKNPNYGHHINYYQRRNIRIHLNYTQDWNETTGCGVCHQEQYLATEEEKKRFRRSKTIHDNYDKSNPSSRCDECHPSSVPQWHCDFTDTTGKTCTICHAPYKRKSNIHLHLNYTQDWDGSTGCGVCHQEQYLATEEEKERFRRSKTIHDNYQKSRPSSRCFDCHISHRRLTYISGVTCTGCHTPDTDKKTGPNYLHNRFSFAEGIACIDCHSTSHEKGTILYAEGDTKAELERKCKACHTSEKLTSIRVSCKPGRFDHKARAHCLNCHDVYKEKNDKYIIEKGHYALTAKTGNMRQGWAGKDNYSDSDMEGNFDSGSNMDNYRDSDDNYNDCGVCHGEGPKHPLYPSRKIHDSINAPCNTCHGKHCEMNIGATN
ncbi:CxxxxCH/CxxCH domain-containing protein [bacterium]|nr:CxxxxCH/CxxCH domain-containing protein [bacterium]